MEPKIIPVQPFDMVIFGGTGDLAMRKILPALYYRDKDKQMPVEGRIIGISRAKITQEDYIAQAKAALVEYVAAKDLDDDTEARFLQRLHYFTLDAKGDNGWQPLIDLLAARPQVVRAFYLSTPPKLFGPICQNLARKNLITESSRVVVEKPIGTSLASAQKINEEIGAVFQENQIFRIDHYLGKETVQNLMALRFANSLFEPLWNHQWIDHVQISVAEAIGIGGRGEYYDSSGALRDMVQNHILQLLCIVAMEPPVVFGADAVRDEKLKVLRALRAIGPREVRQKTVRGRYASGAVDGKSVIGYMEEEGVPQDSITETFVAIKAEVDNWRWSGVPFYLRTGKRMPERRSEIVIQFKETPHLIFPKNVNQVRSNRLAIRLQPKEGIRLYLMTKVPGPGGMRMRQVPLNLSFAEAFQDRFPLGYERLLMDVLRGNATLFMRRDEVETAWSWCEPILQGWAEMSEKPQSYNAGTWGPTSSIALVERDNRTWYEEGY
ncbi:glucose-6-phosphate dehydrogenase [Acanthopleuribacter pedis]|uniref:Glucose-6-phosphate 1-dehydrogenase n=1 Tax=Acanthopleuribacter pedis TaxID=442870 RepID=A0A8J7U3R1_9BACT|nr:glucose-6-phosphate dehydrogenase [Acanthopleuribacter pedis]MBO1317526.1 glucose-6-phosphate dehydrogenase [Acanthopleuribacter pedis]